MHAVPILEAFLLTLSISLDAFVACFAYGSHKIKIPLPSVIVINLVCSGILGVSLLAGSFIRAYLSPWVCSVICFVLLFVIGITKLLDHITKAVIQKHGGLSKDIQFSLFNLKFVLNVYADPKKADADCSKSISLAEAASLSVALSLDGLAVGFGAAIGNASGLAVFLLSFLTDTAAVVFGIWIGNKAADKLRLNIAFLSGVLLILLAFSKLL